MRKPRMATFFTVAQATGQPITIPVPEAAMLMTAQPPITTGGSGGGGTYMFDAFVAPSYSLSLSSAPGTGVNHGSFTTNFAGPSGNQYAIRFADGQTATATVVNNSAAVSWSPPIGAAQSSVSVTVGGHASNAGTLARPWTLNDVQVQALNYNVLGVIGDQGMYTPANAGNPLSNVYPDPTWHNHGNYVILVPVGNGVTQRVLASCNSSGAYVPPGFTAGLLGKGPTYISSTATGVAPSGIWNGAIFDWTHTGAWNPASPYWLYAFFGGDQGTSAYNVVMDGIEQRNYGGMKLVGGSNVTVKNCWMHHGYNPDDTVAFTSSCANGIMTVTAISRGQFVLPFFNSYAMQVWNITTGGGVTVQVQASGTPGGIGTYDLSLISTFLTLAPASGATSGTLGNGGNTNPTNWTGQTNSGYRLVFPDGESISNVTLTNGSSAVNWGTPLTASQTSRNLSIGTAWASTSLGTASSFPGGNLAGMEVNGVGSTMTGNFVHAIQDKNTAIVSNGRSTGIKSFPVNNAAPVCQFNTIYADPVTFQPFEGVAYKDPSFSGGTISNNFIHLLNANLGSVLPNTGEYECISITGGNLTGSLSIVYNVKNNICLHPSTTGIRTPGSGGSFQMTLNMSNNLFESKTGGQRSLYRPFPANTNGINAFNNIYGQLGSTSASFGNVSFNVDAWSLCDFNLYKSGDAYGAIPSGGSSPGTANVFAIPANLNTVQSRLSASTVGKEEHSVFASAQFQGSGGLRASDYKLVLNSPGTATSVPGGHGGATGPGSSDGTITGAATDMGPWGNGATQVGCGWLEPGDLA
jgi:hypothetical protein